MNSEILVNSRLAFHLILCEQVTLLIIGAEHDLIKGGMFYPCSALLSLHHPEEASPPLSGQGGPTLCKINPSSPL